MKTKGFVIGMFIGVIIFYEKQKGNKFSPELLRDLSNYFKTSLTSVAFKYLELGDHPICLFHFFNKVVKYWMRNDDFPHYIIDKTKLAPPEDSVAMEYFEKGKIYTTYMEIHLVRIEELGE